MEPLEQISPESLGERLRIARENAKLTQEDAADAIDVARTTIVAMEQGQRRVRMGELQKLTKAYRTSVNALLRQEAVHVDLAPRFRKMFDAKDTAAVQAADLLPGDIRSQAEHDATELRNRLGLGMRPVPDIMTLLELEMGVRVYVRRLDSRISGLFAYDEALGPCILLNASHPRERRVQSAGHETGHFISSRRSPEILYRNEKENTREERYANSFGRAFLTPTRGVMQKFQEVTAGSDKLTRRHVIILAHFFGVSREAMVRRLEELSLVKEGTWDWFQSNGGITDDQARQVLGEVAVPDPDKADADKPITLGLASLAAEAYRKELLSEGQLARLLCLDRIELREILDSQQSEGIEIDGTIPNLVD
jgi:Zn-dependent peptidase ImmA (M78 family)/DNA-binding XRE family transcriptional regulator